MKRYFQILLIALVVSPLIACQPNESGRKARIGTARGARGTPQYNTTGTAPQPGQTATTRPPTSSSTTYGAATWGAIYGGGYFTEDQFNSNVHDFVAATMDPSELGTVSGQMNQSTGIRFWAYVQTSTPFNSNSYSSATISGTNSILRIVIWDSYAGQVDSSGELIPEYAIDMRGTATGQISGNNAVVRFSDGYGWIEIRGNFDAQNFTGTVWFDNTNGAANYLGIFSISTCSFFKCN